MTPVLPPHLLAKYDRRIPRYTSYPTAPHFQPGTDAPTYAAWLGGLPADATLSLYIHVPFCDTLCWFCGCHTKVVKRHEPVAAYVDLLLGELDLVAAALGGGRPLVHLHLGGGSPTMLSPGELERLRGALDARFTFAPGAEIAVEIDPRGLTRETVAALAAFGVNRASIGVQDTDPVVQRTVNRIQPMEVTATAVERLRRAGVKGINIDLMYGLPRQTTAGVLATVEEVLALSPDRLALFGYAHVPAMKAHQRLLPERELPGPDERLSQLEAASARLVVAGYRAIGLDHFARPGDPLAIAAAAGRLRRNFQGYTTDAAAALVGIGASAIGELPQGYVQNLATVPEYRARILAGRLATARGVALSPDDRLRRAVIERLMCDLAVDLDAVARPFGADAKMFGRERAALDEMAADGLIDLAWPRIALRPAARPLLRAVAAVFDAYLTPDTQRHARAV